MSEEAPRTYSALSSEEQSAVSVWIDSFEASYEYEGAAALKQAVRAAPDRLRPALVSQLLPPLIDRDRQQQGRTPTLHELRARFPELAGDLSAAYPLLADAYRLPVELRGYRVLRVVGEGGQAIVLRAQDEMHSAVAIKLSVSPKQNEFLLRERELLGQCQHPGVPEVIASGVEEDRAYFVMPFLRGMTLADKYATHRPATDEAIRIATELCEIVDHLHFRGILHRDIKPSNVWLDDSGSVKLIDLGMAIDRSSWGTPRVAVAEFHGTPAFMSPEQAALDGENDGELSDVFSIGAVLYWMGKGTSPCGSGSKADLLAQAAKTLEQDQLHMVAGWPKRLTRICLKAIATEPSKRPDSAAALNAELKRVSTGGTALRVGIPRQTMAAVLLLVLAVSGFIARPDRLLRVDTRQTPPSKATYARQEIEEKPPGLSWIEQMAAKHGLKLASVRLEDFEPGVRCRARLLEPWGENPRGLSVHPELTIELNKDLDCFGPALEYRLGDSVWSTLTASEQPGRYAAPLSMLASGERGPVEVRLVHNPSGRTETAAGPFRYEIDIALALREDEQAFGRELLKEAMTTKCFDVDRSGWTIRNQYAQRIGPIVDEFYFGEDRQDLSPVYARLDKLVGRNRDDIEKQSRIGLREGFSLVSKNVQDARKLWVGIRFSGGGSFGPVLYAKPLNEQQKKQDRVIAWFSRLKPDDEVVIFNRSQLVLTRLNEILPELSHLHLVGHRYDYSSNQKNAVMLGGGKNASNTAGRDMIASSELEVELARLTGERTITLPPIWDKVTIKGRIAGGGFTPEVEATNRNIACGTAIKPIHASSRVVANEIYLWIEHSRYRIPKLSVVPYLTNFHNLNAAGLRQAEKARFVLTPIAPEMAGRVEYYADSKFTRRLQVIAPGTIYARFFGLNDQPIGHAVYPLTAELLHSWAMHAYAHASGEVSD